MCGLNVGTYNSRKLFRLLIQIGNRLKWEAIANHANCHSNFQNWSRVADIKGGQSEDTLPLEVIA